MKIKKICKKCGKEFETYRSNAKFCNEKCSYKYKYYGKNGISKRASKFVEDITLYEDKEFKNLKNKENNFELECLQAIEKIKKEMGSPHRWRMLIMWSDPTDDFLFNFFKARYFNKQNLTELDKEIIRTRVRLFKVQRGRK